MNTANVIPLVPVEDHSLVAENSSIKYLFGQQTSLFISYGNHSWFLHEVSLVEKRQHACKIPPCGKPTLKALCSKTHTCA